MVATGVTPLRKRGANVVVTAQGQALFRPGTDLWKWKNVFTAKIKAATEAAAPANKRPRWGHYGKPLKATIVATTRTRVTSGGGFFYMAVGSKAPYAQYVDQGTGVFAGKEPWLARVIPPYRRNSPSLYESYWRPGGPGNPKVSPVLIKGQRPQNFFDAGLKRGFQAMRMRSFQVPGEGASAIRSALSTIPTGIEGFIGNTPPDAGFIASLTEWRLWRDTAFNANAELGRTRGGVQGRRSVRYGTRASRARGLPGRPYRQRRTPAQDERRREESAKRSQRYRDSLSSAKKDQTNKARKQRDVNRQAAIRTERARFLAAALKKYGTFVLLDTLSFDGTRWSVTVLKPNTKTSGSGKVPSTIVGKPVG